MSKYNKKLSQKENKNLGMIFYYYQMKTRDFA